MVLQVSRLASRCLVVAVSIGTANAIFASLPESMPVGECRAGPELPAGRDLRDLGQVVAAFERAFNAQDAAGLSGLFAADGVLHDWRGRAATSPARIRQNYEEGFREIRGSRRVTLEDGRDVVLQSYPPEPPNVSLRWDRVSALGEDESSIEGTWCARGALGPTGAVLPDVHRVWRGATGYFRLNLRREGGRWAIVHLSIEAPRGRGSGALSGESKVYFALAERKVVEQKPDRGLFVAGRLEDDRFTPEGEIEGSGELAGERGGTPGWVELASGTFYMMATAKAKEAPSVDGEMGADGLFRPYARAIDRQGDVPSPGPAPAILPPDTFTASAPEWLVGHVLESSSEEREDGSRVEVVFQALEVHRTSSGVQVGDKLRVRYTRRLVPGRAERRPGPPGPGPVHPPRPPAEGAVAVAYLAAEPETTPTVYAPAAHQYSFRTVPRAAIRYVVSGGFTGRGGDRLVVFEDGRVRLESATPPIERALDPEEHARLLARFADFRPSAARGDCPDGLVRTVTYGELSASMNDCGPSRGTADTRLKRIVAALSDLAERLRQQGHDRLDGVKLRRGEEGWILGFSLDGEPKSLPVPSGFLLAESFDESVTAFPIGDGRVGLHASSYVVSREGSAQAAEGTDAFLTLDPRSLDLRRGGLDLGMTKGRHRRAGCWEAVFHTFLVADVDEDGLQDLGVVAERMSCEERFEDDVDLLAGPFHTREPVRWHLYRDGSWSYDQAFDARWPTVHRELPRIGLVKSPIEFVRELQPAPSPSR